MTRIIDQISIQDFAVPERRADWENGLADALEQFIQGALPQLTITDWQVTGSFGSGYDHPKYHGPHSALRHRYDLHLQFTSSDGTETLTDRIEYDPESRRIIVPGSPSVNTLAMQQSKRQNEDEYNTLFHEVMGRLTAGEDLRICPRCSGTLIVSRGNPGQPNIKHVECSNGCIKVMLD